MYHFFFLLIAIQLFIGCATIRISNNFPEAQKNESIDSLSLNNPIIIHSDFYGDRYPIRSKYEYEKYLCEQLAINYNISNCFSSGDLEVLSMSNPIQIHHKYSFRKSKFLPVITALPSVLTFGIFPIMLNEARGMEVKISNQNQVFIPKPSEWITKFENGGESGISKNEFYKNELYLGGFGAIPFMFTRSPKLVEWDPEVIWLKLKEKMEIFKSMPKDSLYEIFIKNKDVLSKGNLAGKITDTLQIERAIILNLTLRHLFNTNKDVFISNYKGFFSEVAVINFYKRRFHFTAVKSIIPAYISDLELINKWNQSGGTIDKNIRPNFEYETFIPVMTQGLKNEVENEQ